MSRWVNKYVIGLTGNIAVGKSVIRQMLQHLGAYTIDADGLAHQAMAPGAPAYRPIVEAFGQFILDSEKRINRAQLATIVFSNPEALAKLEAITHPVIGQAINTLVSRAQQPIVVIEAIKLLEGDLAKAVDTIWVVDAKPETQYRRLIEKRKLSEADAKQRILSQGAQGEKLKKAHFVIRNDGNVEDTWKQVQIGWAEVRKALASGSQPPAPAKPVAPAQTQAAPPAAAAPAQPKPAPAAPPTQSPPAAVPAKPAAAQPTPAAPPAPAPAAVMPARDDDGEVPLTPPPPGLEVKRGMPGNAQQIADFINRFSNKGISRMDVMMSFGMKSYLIAEKEDETVVAVAGWQVENLITRVDELYFDDAAGTPKPVMIQGLVSAIEEASKALQSEVGFIFIPSNSDQETFQAFANFGYEKTTITEIKIPAWREAVQELMSDQVQILRKQLRKDRVLQPI